MLSQDIGVGRGYSDSEVLPSSHPTLPHAGNPGVRPAQGAGCLAAGWRGGSFLTNSKDSTSEFLEGFQTISSLVCL